MKGGYFKKLGKTVVALGVISLLNDISSEMIYPVLPIFLTIVLGATPVQLGIIEGVAETTASMLKLFFGYYSDRLKRKKPFIVSGYALTVIARVAIAFSASWTFVLGCRFLDRAGKGIRTAPRDALISLQVADEDMGKAFGFHRGMDHLGALLGPIIAFAILSIYADNYKLLFICAGIIGLFSVIGAAAFLKEKKQKISEYEAGIEIKLESFSRRFYFFIASIFVFTLGNSSDAFLLLKAQNSGVKVVLIPILWSVLHLSKSIFSIVGGNLSDKMSRKSILIAGWIIYMAVYSGFAVLKGEAAVWTLFAIYGVYFGFTEGVQKAIIADIVPDSEKRGTAYGVYNFAIGIGNLPASIMFGIIWSRFGEQYAFFTGAALAGLAIAMVSLVRT